MSAHALRIHTIKSNTVHTREVIGFRRAIRSTAYSIKCVPHSTCTCRTKESQKKNKSSTIKEAKEKKTYWIEHKPQRENSLRIIERICLCRHFGWLSIFSQCIVCDNLIGTHSFSLCWALSVFGCFRFHFHSVNLHLSIRSRQKVNFVWCWQAHRLFDFVLRFFFSVRCSFFILIVFTCVERIWCRIMFDIHTIWFTANRMIHFIFVCEIHTHGHKFSFERKDQTQFSALLCINHNHFVSIEKNWHVCILY